MKIIFAECTNNGIMQGDSNELFLVYTRQGRQLSKSLNTNYAIDHFGCCEIFMMTIERSIHLLKTEIILIDRFYAILVI